MMTNHDAIIIGAGQAASPLAVKLANAGMKVAIIERHLFGGTCVNTGCIPTKTLIASAYAAHITRQANEFGVVINGSIDVDMKKVKARMDKVRQKYQSDIEPWLQGTQNCTIYKGTASFENAHTVRVNNELLEAKLIFINVGGRAVIPPMPGIDQIKYLTNSSMMDIDELPEHLIIVGGSYVGLEFAQMYRRFGSKVSVIEKMDRLILREDQDISEAVKAILENEGVNIHLKSECIAFEKRGDKIVAKLHCDDPSKEVIGSHLLMAVGRRPNTDDLGLAKAGIKADAQGYIIVDDQLQTNIPGIYALGDVNRKGAFTHTAYNDYEIVAGNLLNKENRRVSDRITTYSLFIDPALGRAGLTEEQVRQSGREALIAKFPMSRVKRAVIKNEAQGFMKILIDAKTKQILGAAVLGVEGDEIIHSILDVMYARAPYTLLAQAMHIHPTVSELIPYMLETEVKPLATTLEEDARQ
jgi:pyruvate/2-oxoglutarate dehydrogenase complex dihydrolipoamide dehydrogenase (E3) component